MLAAVVAAPATALAEPADSYQPRQQVRLGDTNLELPASVAATVESVSAFDVDRYGNEVANAAVASPRLRIGARWTSGRAWAPWTAMAEYEHDLATGFVGGDDGLDGALPRTEGLGMELRKAYARVSRGRWLHAGAGLMTSHWGLGLLANDGDHGWTPGSASFSDPRGGDRVLRAFLGFGLSASWGALVTIAGDSVFDDDVTLDGDEARQLIGAAQLGVGLPRGVGVYAVRRHQEDADGAVTDVTVIDVHARAAFALGGLDAQIAGEVAYITGVTELAPSLDYPEHDVESFAAAAQLRLGGKTFGGVVDAIYATGDSNVDDERQTAFKADPRYELGFLLYGHVLASHTGRTLGAGGDPELVGVPSPGLDRYPTRGSVSNTLAAFPRLWWRATDGLEIYGGPLVAMTATDNADPFNSRIAGGSIRNALDEEPGSYLGTELDLGARYRRLLGTSELTVGLEAGALLPGSALTPLSTVFGARAMVGYRL